MQGIGYIGNEELSSHPGTAQRLAIAGSCYTLGKRRGRKGSVEVVLLGLRLPRGNGNHGGYTHREQES